MDSDDDMNVSYEADDPSCLDETVATTDNSNISFSDTSFRSTSDVSDTEGPSTSTPTKSRRVSKRTKKSANSSSTASGSKSTTVAKSQQQPDPFKKPDAPKYFAICPRCRSGLKTPQGFSNHMLSHKWKDLATKQVPLKEIASHLIEEGHSVLQVIEDTKYTGLHGKEIINLASSLKVKTDSEEWKSFLKTLTDAVVSGFRRINISQKGAAFPSAVRGKVLTNISLTFSDKEFLDDILEKLLRVQLVPTVVAYPFLVEFYRKLSNFALVFVIKSFGARDKLGNNLRSKDDFSSALSHRVVHYIAGSTIKSQMRHCYRYRQNSRLQRIKDCILKRIATVGTPSVCQENEKSYWTHLLNRKSLMFVNDSVFPFFLELAQIVQKLERADGGLGHEAVMDVVAATPTILSKWDATIDNQLNEEESFRFMVKVVRTYTNTYGRGVLLRRMNKHCKKGKGNKATSSVSYRAQLL